MADGETEARFAHLLQPIRDMARNWDIDIATALEDYLDELDQLKISLDGGQTNLNFAEAALLIQGTACIYSRKVEYLHSLVFQVLDRLTGQQAKQAKQKAGAGAGAHDGDDDEEGLGGLGGGGATDPFLLLDDVLDEGKDIDLKPQVVLASLRGAASKGGRREGGRDGGDPHCRPPLLVMDDHGNSFKVATCTVHKSGALLMEESLRRELEPELREAERAGRRRPSYGLSRNYDSAGGEQPQGEQAMGANNDDDDDSYGGGGGDDAWAGGNDDQWGPMDDDGGFPMDNDGPYPEDQGQQQQLDGGNEAAPMATEAGPAAEDGEGEGRALRSRFNQPQPGLEDGEDDDEDEEEDDPWKLLDPHDPGKSQPRPFRKGKAPRAPALPKSAPPSAAAASSLLPVVLSLTGLSFPEFLPLAKALEARLKSQARRAVAASRLAAAADKDDRRASGRRRSMAMYAAVTAPAFVAEGRVAEAENMAMDEGGPGADLEDDDDDDMVGGADAAWVNDDGAYYDGGDDDFRMDDDGYTGDTYAHEHEAAAAIDMGDDGRHRRRSYAPVSLEDGGLLADAFSDAPQSYEALCRKHMDAFMRGLEAYAHETQLTRRVADWQDKVEPMLEVQEKRTPFDIHDCGDEILESLGGKAGHEGEGEGENAGDKANEGDAGSKRKSSGKQQQQQKQQPPQAGDKEDADGHELRFKEIVSGKEQYEVCRLFLASLQLANNGNVQLVHQAGPQDADGLSFKMQLLSDQRMHERFTGAELGDIETH